MQPPRGSAHHPTCTGPLPPAAQYCHPLQPATCLLPPPPHAAPLPQHHNPLRAGAPAPRGIKLPPPQNRPRRPLAPADRDASPPPQAHTNTHTHKHTQHVHRALALVATRRGRANSRNGDHVKHARACADDAKRPSTDTNRSKTQCGRPPKLIWAQFDRPPELILDKLDRPQKLILAKFDRPPKPISAQFDRPNQRGYIPPAFLGYSKWGRNQSHYITPALSGPPNCRGVRVGRQALVISRISSGHNPKSPVLRISWGHGGE